MQRLVRLPADKKEWLEMRARDLTSTEVPALFGLSPYTTVYELYHRKINNEFVEEFTGNQFTKWGQRLESAIAHGIAEDNCFGIRKMDEYISIPELRLGASFDFAIENDPNNIDKVGILEIKNVFGMIFNDQWITDDGVIEAPPHIEIQVQTQMAVSERSFANIGALISGNKVELIKRKPDQEIINNIYEKTAEFWYMVDNKIEPKPDFVKDASLLAKIYGYAEPDKIMDARENKEIAELAAAYKEAGRQESVAKKNKTAAKSQLLTLIDDAEKCIGENFSISAGMIAPTTVESYEKKGYRNFRVNFKKPKKKKETNNGK